MFFLFSAMLGVLMAAALSQIPLLDFGFREMLLVLLSVDVVNYIAMKSGFMREPRDRT